MTIEHDLVWGFTQFWIPKTENFKVLAKDAITTNNPHQTKEWAVDRLNHWWNLGTKKFPPKNGKTDVPRIRFDDRMTARNGGTAHSGKHLITLTTRYLQEDDFENTIVHEVCHILANYHYGQGCAHSARWKTVMLGLGYMPHRCHTYLCLKTELKCKCGHANIIMSDILLKKLKSGITTYRCEKCKLVLELPKKEEI